ncbi:hypothetical protein BDV41DRAFT_572961 [Aspergillus transmontanensis]|uniref:Uncharacterized protein n=1 Tax=Aspergillus transmontanensis TaxID=1034304 RepID=A0A5N6W8S7_9EURO|nr:hypothetical protein BDV41DRAFT_572961 [Aspergillus transmontanensis]
MTKNTFFDDWANRKVDFGHGAGSIWTLNKLYSEKNSQVDNKRLHEYQWIGGAYGTFLCHNVMDKPLMMDLSARRLNIGKPKPNLFPWTIMILIVN